MRLSVDKPGGFPKLQNTKANNSDNNKKPAEEPQSALHKKTS